MPCQLSMKVQRFVDHLCFHHQEKAVKFTTSESKKVIKGGVKRRRESSSLAIFDLC